MPQENEQLITPGGIPYAVIFEDERSKLVEFRLGDGEKPLRQLFSGHVELQVDAYLLLNDEGAVTGVLTHDLASFWGGEEVYQEHHQDVTVVPAVIIPGKL